MLAGALSRQLLQAITRRHQKIFDPLGGVQDQEFLERRSLESRREAPRPLAEEDGLSVVVAECAYHRRR